MKKSFFLALVILLCTSINAQQSLTKNSAIISPEIHSNNTVTFRLNAPHAEKVQLVGEFLNTPVVDMVKNANNIWEYTTPEPLASELYNYFFLVDGLKVLDPTNVYLNRDVATIMNYFIINGDPGNNYKVNNVPHGTVSHIWYYSPTLKMNRRLTVYTPHGYESNKSKYPVLYLLHGMGGDEEAWISLGRAPQILDNLIASGQAKPMIVVMPNGNASQEAAPGQSSLPLAPPSFYLPKTMEGSFETSFPDIVKFVTHYYRTIDKKSDRAICGLSMGGFHSKYISAEYPDMFDYVGLFSAAISADSRVKSEIYQNPADKLKIQFSKKPKLYWIGIGNEDFLYKANTDYRKFLDENHYPYTYYETGKGHIWRNWRTYLIQFTKKIFN